MNDALFERLLRSMSEEEILASEQKLHVNYEKFERVKRTARMDRMYLMKCNRENNRVFPFQFHSSIIIMRHTRFVPVKIHVHDWIELAYMFDGSCSQVINQKTKLELKKGQVLLLNQNAAHSIANTGEQDILVNILIEKKYFDENFFEKISQNNILVRFLMNAIMEKDFHNNYILFQSEKSERIQFYMKEIMKEFMTPANENSKSVIDNLISLVFLELISIYQTEQIFSEMNLGKNSIAIMKYIESNYRTCTLGSVAEVFNMNPNYMSGMLKQKLGYTFKELVQYYRFNYVTTMLQNTDESVEKIMQNAGCENATYFYKKFKEKYGCTPGQYREIYLAESEKV